MKDLMKPRWKLIADYPGSIISVGTVIEVDGDSAIVTSPSGAVSIQSGYVFRSLKQYPHLFKRLKWWEHRPVEDLPEYANLEGEVMEFWRAHIKSLSLDDFVLEPATKEEYEQYTNKLQIDEK